MYTYHIMRMKKDEPEQHLVGIFADNPFMQRAKFTQHVRYASAAHELEEYIQARAIVLTF